MATKRKRSTPSLFTDITTQPSTVSSPPPRLPHFFAQSKDIPQAPWKPAQITPTLHYPSAQQDAPPQMNSRTRKRWRDDRPNDAQIHANTMQKLFQAQKAHPDAEPLPSQPQTQELQYVEQKSTLHSFWQLPQQLPRHGAPVLRQELGLNCEDCDGLIVVEGLMDAEMDCQCRACGKRVCGACAVVGDGRSCLDCAMLT